MTQKKERKERKKRTKKTGDGFTPSLGGMGFTPFTPVLRHETNEIPPCSLDKCGSGLFSSLGKGVGGADYAHSTEGGSMGIGGTLLHINHPSLHPSNLDCRSRSRHFV